MVSTFHGDQKIVVGFLSGLWMLAAYSTLLIAQEGASQRTAEQQQRLDEAKRLNDHVERLYREGKSKEAISLATQALAIRQEILGDNHADTALSLNNLGAQLEAQGNFTAARPYYEQALKIRKKVLGSEHPHTAMSLNSLGYLLQTLGDYSAARPHFEESLRIRQKIFGEEHLDTAASLNNLGLLLHAQADYATARPHLEKALKIRRKVLGEEHVQTATSLNNLGFLLRAQGEYVAARTYYEQALKIRKKVLGEEHTHTALSLNNLGYLLQTQGDYVAARPYYEESLRIRQKVLGNSHQDTAMSLQNLGSLHQAQGDYAAARIYFEQSLTVKKRVLGEEHPDTATLLNDLGLLLQTQGNYAAARSYYEQALRIKKKSLGNEHPNTATTLNDLGLLLHFQGDYAAARDYFEQALKIRKKALGDRHPHTATSLHNLGFLLQTQGDLASAQANFEESLKILKNVVGDEHPTIALLLNNLGYLLQEQGDFVGARSYFELSLKIRRKVLGEDHPETANSLNNLGVLLHAQGDFAAARSYLEQSSKIKIKMLGDDHPDSATLLNNLVVLEVASGDVDRAEELMDQSRRGARRHVARVLPALTEKEQRLFLEQKDEVGFHAALSLGYVRRGEPTSTKLSAEWLLNGKGVAHAALSEQTLMTRDLKNPQLNDVVEKMRQARQQLATLTLSAPRSGQENARRETLEKLTTEVERYSRKLTEESGRVTEIDPWMDVSRVQNSLPKGTVLIDIARFKVLNFHAKVREKFRQPSRYVAWIIHAGESGDIRIVDLGMAEPIESAIKVARKTIQAASDENSLLRREGEPAAEKQVSEALKPIVDLVWKPLAAEIADAQQIVLSPDGALWLVPWAALPISDKKVLLETYPLHYVVSGRDVVKKKTKDLPPTKPLIFADPDFDLPAESVKQSIQNVFPDRKFNDDHQTRGFVSQSAMPKVGRLPNTATEAQVIAPNIEYLFKEKPQTYTDRYALESIFKNVNRPALLVLSSHGFFLPDQEVKDNDKAPLASNDHRSALLTADGKMVENPLLRCGLLFAGCNSELTTDVDDGVLTGLEIVGVDLRGTELVVLSACETGVGEIRNGEGVAGLRQAFQLAGAKAVVATLWQVPDRDSMLIMNDFFQNLADGQSKSDALRNAQLKRIKARRDRNGGAHPFFWAAWTLTGHS